MLQIIYFYLIVFIIVVKSLSVSSLYQQTSLMILLKNSSHHTNITYVIISNNYLTDVSILIYFKVGKNIAQSHFNKRIMLKISKQFNILNIIKVYFIAMQVSRKGFHIVYIKNNVYINKIYIFYLLIIDVHKQISRSYAGLMNY